jgi:Helicase conserved C-terminal domain
VASTLTRWLRTLDPDALARLLRRRPETRSAPVPRDIGELASRLQGRMGVATAFQSVPLPAVQVLETVRAFGCGTRDELAALLGEDGLDATLALLADHALLWTYDGQLYLAGEVRTGLGYPLRLGPAAEELLQPLPIGKLREVAEMQGMPVPGLKKELRQALLARYKDPQALRDMVAKAPPDAQRMLEAAAWQGPLVREPERVFSAGGAHYLGTAGWAVEHGLLLPDGWQQLVMPREVALAMRGPDWRPRFDPEPPAPRLVPADPAAVEREAAAAAGAVVDQVGAVLAAVPIALLKAGGVGAREQRRLARAAGMDEPAVRLCLELAYGAALVARNEGFQSRRTSLAGSAKRLQTSAGDELLPTEGYDDWCAADPADRLLPLLVAWYGLPAFPLRDPTALVRDPSGRLALDLRADLLRAAGGVPDGHGLADPVAHLEAAVRWRLPVLAEAFDEFPDTIGPLWTEAERLGVAAHGALTSLGRAMLAVDGTALAEAARRLLDDATEEAIFQADLTAVVPGTPSAALADLLGGVADRESRGSASTWRFSAGSVRRALDAGRGAEELAVELRAVAVGGTLPQPLEYLLTDVARRHGRIRVRTVGCVLHADDPALLAELTATRALAALRLTALAPGVLTSARPAKETLEALRAAGYAPVGEDASGEPVIERVSRRRATKPAYPPAPRRPKESESDPVELAKALLSAPPVEPPAPVIRITKDTAKTVDRHARHLDDEERRLLAHAIDTGTAVRIHYTDTEGRQSVRVIEPIDLSGNALDAWCQLRDDERHFALDRIEAVGPI